VDVTAYDDLIGYRFATGRGYDKQSVETFRALALNQVDDLLHQVTALRDELAQGGGVTDPDERELLTMFRNLGQLGRVGILDAARDGGVPAPPHAQSTAQPQAPAPTPEVHSGTSMAWLDDSPSGPADAGGSVALDDFLSSPGGWGGSSTTPSGAATSTDEPVSDWLAGLEATVPGEAGDASSDPFADLFASALNVSTDCLS
jgi:hypothetical protein